jgi:cell division septum initiation protein DivIVA
MTKKDYQNFEKDHIQQLQQRIDELETRLKHTTNELSLCKEQQEYPKELSKGNKTITPLPRYEKSFATDILEDRLKAILEDREKSIKKMNEKE